MIGIYLYNQVVMFVCEFSPPNQRQITSKTTESFSVIIDYPHPLFYLGRKSKEGNITFSMDVQNFPVSTIQPTTN